MRHNLSQLDNEVLSTLSFFLRITKVLLVFLLHKVTGHDLEGDILLHLTALLFVPLRISWHNRCNERIFTSEHIVNDEPERPKVGAWTNRSFLDVFWRAVTQAMLDGTNNQVTVDLER